MYIVCTCGISSYSIEHNYLLKREVLLGVRSWIKDFPYFDHVYAGHRVVNVVF